MVQRWRTGVEWIRITSITRTFQSGNAQFGAPRHMHCMQSDAFHGIDAERMSIMQERSEEEAPARIGRDIQTAATIKIIDSTRNPDRLVYVASSTPRACMSLCLARTLAQR